MLDGISGTGTGSGNRSQYDNERVQSDKGLFVFDLTRNSRPSDTNVEIPSYDDLRWVALWPGISLAKWIYLYRWKKEILRGGR